MIITIDGGTTNTRVTACSDGTILSRVKISAGAGNTPSDLLKIKIKAAISQLLDKHGECESGIEAIFASGMLTSELGIYKLDHITAPSDIKKLRNGSVCVLVPEISEQKITFVPGIKNNADYSDITNLEEADVMRGEETEIVGIMAKTEIDGSFTAVLPGSHTKLVSVDENKAIIKCHTAIGGELLSAVPTGTILKSSVDMPLISENGSLEFLLKGYELCEKLGFNTAAFKARVMANFFGYSKSDSAMLLAGIILAPDIKAIDEMSNGGTIVLGGSAALKKAFSYLIKHILPNNVIEVSDEVAENATVFGCMKLFEG